MRKRPNITLRELVDDIHEVLERTRVALVPSLWAEARSRIILEAMVRGIPVLASNVGGLPEAMLGMDYLLSIHPVKRYRAAIDELMVPVAEIPRQEIAPWLVTLQGLITDQARYQELSAKCRAAALNYTRDLSALPFEEYLGKIVQLPKGSAAAGNPAGDNLQEDALSPEKRRLLASRLRRRKPHPSRIVEEQKVTAPEATAIARQ